MNPKILINHAIGGFLGLAIGDSIGAQVEFKKRGTFPLVTDMVGGGVFNLCPGQITDDTEMALAVARSLAEKKQYDPNDIMDRFLDWSRNTFDIGNATHNALKRYARSRDPYQGIEDNALSGNGSIMRLYPSILWSLHMDKEAALEFVWDTSRLTHASNLVFETTNEMFDIIRKIFADDKKEEILQNYFFNELPDSSGFVRHTLDAAIWAFQKSKSFEEGLLKAVNLGDDADTVGAVYGQIAGTYYGKNGIPEKWITLLECREEIEKLVPELLKKCPT